MMLFLTPAALPELKDAETEEIAAAFRKVGLRPFTHWRAALALVFFYGCIAAPVVFAWDWIMEGGRASAARAALAVMLGGLAGAPVLVHFFLSESRRYLR